LPVTCPPGHEYPGGHGNVATTVPLHGQWYPGVQGVQSEGAVLAVELASVPLGQRLGEDDPWGQNAPAGHIPPYERVESPEPLGEPNRVGAPHVPTADADWLNPGFGVGDPPVQ
jgi:hypothetical protein